MQIDWSELHPCATFANRLPCTPGFIFGPRTIQDHQFIYIVKGKGTARIHQNRYAAVPGDLFYYGPHVVHEFRADGDEPFTVFGLHFTLTGETAPVHIRETAFAETPERENMLMLGDAFRIPEQSRPGSWMQDRLAILVELYRLGDSLSSFRSRAVLMELLASLSLWAAKNDFRESKHAEPVSRMKALLEQNAQLAYSRDWLSKLTSYHENHAARLFREHSGMSPHEYHSRQKMSLARQWLLETDLQVTEIAERLQFTSVHYFSRSFHRMVGMTPTEYRQMRYLV